MLGSSSSADARSSFIICQLLLNFFIIILASVCSSKGLNSSFLSFTLPLMTTLHYILVSSDKASIFFFSLKYFVNTFLLCFSSLFFSCITSIDIFPENVCTRGPQLWFSFTWQRSSLIFLTYTSHCWKWNSWKTD